MDIDKRIEDLARAIDQSMANHNALVGRLEEARHFKQELEQKKILEESSSDAHDCVSGD